MDLVARAPLTRQQLADLRARPDAARRMLDLADAGDRLTTYMAAMWHILEPGQRFVSGWAMDGIAEHLEAVTRGQIRRLLLNVPPGFSKSLTTDVLWPSWEWGP